MDVGVSVVGLEVGGECEHAGDRALDGVLDVVPDAELAAGVGGDGGGISSIQLSSYLAVNKGLSEGRVLEGTGLSLSAVNVHSQVAHTKRSLSSRLRRI